MRPARPSPWWSAAVLLAAALAGCNGPTRPDQNIDAQVAHDAADRQHDEDERSAEIMRLRLLRLGVARLAAER